MPSGHRGETRHVLVVYGDGRGGSAALREGAELAASGASLTVVTLAPQAKPLRCCGGGGAGPYNCAVRDVAEEELRTARKQLDPLTASRATFTTLVGQPAPPLAEWALSQGFDLMIVPRDGLTRRDTRRLARDLRAAGGNTEIRLTR